MVLSPINSVIFEWPTSSSNDPDDHFQFVYKPDRFVLDPLTSVCQIVKPLNRSVNTMQCAILVFSICP